jgi:hypothetical protein
MKKIIIILLIAQYSLYCNDSINITLLPVAMFGVDYKFDFRYCNNLIKENISSNKIEDAYSSLINYHNSINNITDFIKYIYNARKNIENNQTTWLFSNPVEIFAKLKTSLMKNDPIENYFPYILHVGMYESEFGSIQRTKLLNGFKKSKYNLQFSELNKLNDDIFYFKIYVSSAKSIFLH